MGKLNETAKTTTTKTKKKAPPRPAALKEKEENTVTTKTTTTKTKYDQDDKLPRHARVAVQFRNIAGRLGKRVDDMKDWNKSDTADLKTVVEKLTHAQKVLTECAYEMARLPDDYTPKARGAGKGASSKAQIIEGSKVKVRDDRHEKYDGLLPLDDEFEVLGFRKRNVKIRTSEGPLFVPRGDLVPVAEAAA